MVKRVNSVVMYTVNVEVLVLMDVQNCKGVQSLVTHSSSKRSFQPLHTTKTAVHVETVYVNSCYKCNIYSGIKLGVQVRDPALKKLRIICFDFRALQIHSDVSSLSMRHVVIRVNTS